MSSICVIFDLDGTLVDSEGLCNRAFLDLLPELDEREESLIQRYRGKKLTPILNDLEKRLGQKLPSDFEQRYRAHVEQLFSRELRAIPGTHEMLAALPYPGALRPVGRYRRSVKHWK